MDGDFNISRVGSGISRPGSAPVLLRGSVSRNQQRLIASQHTAYIERAGLLEELKQLRLR